MGLKHQEFIEAARASGAGHGRIVWHHILPNVLSPLIVVATLDLARTIILESTLSFLGLGIQPPTPSWGGMLSDGREYLLSAWWIATFPGLALMLTALSFNRLGDWIRDLTDPRLRRLEPRR
jgi:peptide/nickel transport system permease protein